MKKTGKMTGRSVFALTLAMLLTAVTGCAASQPAQTDMSAASEAVSEPEAADEAEPEQEEAAQVSAEIPEILPDASAENSEGTQTDTAKDGTKEDLPMKDMFKDYFRFGVAVQAIDHWNDKTAEIGNPDKEALICNEFNSITFGNEWKPAYNFDASSATLYKTDRAAEELLNWCRENSIPVRGHTLVWHSQCDPSIFAKDFKAKSGGKATKDWNAVLDEDCLVDRNTLIERLRTYIRGMIEYTYSQGYADTVYAFDVINEATEEKNPDGLRDSYYYKIIGPEYLYCCFLFAREATLDFSRKYADLYGLDPEKDDLSSIRPKLFYNDYNEWFPARTKIITRFITEDRFNEGNKLFKSDAISPDSDGTIAGDGLIDGIGMQGHLDDTQNIDQYITALRAYDAIVDEVHITELDVGETAAGDLAERKQAAFFNAFFRRLIEECDNGVNLTSVTLWGLTDDASWRKGANPLIFNKDLSPKPAYEALQMAARGEVYDAKNPPALRDATALFYDFEPRTEDGKLISQEPEDMGFMSRGSGHQAALEFVNNENHTENAAIGRSLKVTREEADATVRMDISRFIGETVHVTLWVKTADSSVTMGVTGDSDTVLTTQTSSGDWMCLEASFKLNDALSSAAIYLETDGSSDIFIDDVSVEAQ